MFTPRNLAIGSILFLTLIACSFNDLVTPTGPTECLDSIDYDVDTFAPQTVYSDPTLTPVAPLSAPLPSLNGIHCTAQPGSLLPEPTETPENGVFQRGSIENLTLNKGDAETLDVAINSNGSIISWREQSNFLVLIDRKTYTDFSELGWASDVAVAFSPTGRAHIVYRDGPTFQLSYRASDSGEFIEDKPVERVGSGSDPELIIDADGWAHVFYINGSDAIHRSQGETSWSNPPHLFYGQEAIEAILQDDGSILAAATQGDVITLFRFQNDSWSEIALLHHPHLVGEPRLDNDGTHSYISFVTEELTSTADPAYGFNTIQTAYSSDSGQSWSSLREVGRNEVAGSPSGRIVPPVYPAIAHHAKSEPRVVFLYIFEEGDPPEEVPDALRYGRLRIVRCELVATACVDDPPGYLPLDLLSFFPSENLIIDVNPQHESALIGWTGLQIGEAAREVYATFINPQTLAGD